MNQYIQVSRKLQITRPTTNSPPNTTNQMYILGISNLFAVENWNSYTSTYPESLDLQIGLLSTVSLTNQPGMQQASTLTFGLFTNYPANTWSGGQFRLPVFQQQILLTNSAYNFGSNTFLPIGVTNYETNIGYPLPDWVLSVSNRLVYVLSEAGNIVDFVLLDELSSVTDISRELTIVNPYPGGTANTAIRGVWSTNRTGGISVFVRTDGIKRQMDISLGNTTTSLAEWNSYSQQTVSASDRMKSIDDLRRFAGLGSLYGNTGHPLASDNQLATQAGFSPVAKMIKTTTWQANDPLVHHHRSDLLIYPTNAITQRIVPPNYPVPANTALSTLGLLNTRYAPWGGNPQLNDPFSPNDPTAYTLTVKDPGVRSSDDWNFPTNQPPSLNWLGRVHRGTAWQTIYLKPDVASSGDLAFQGLDIREHPTNDWRLASLLVSLLNTNDPRQLFSINHPSAAAWTTVLDGVTVLSNSVPDNQLSINPALFFDTLLMQSNAPQALLIANAIEAARASRPGGYFRDVSEILSVPELTTSSPWLNLGSSKQLNLGLNDEAYESIPQQILSKLRNDPIAQISVSGNTVQLHFTVFSGHDYDVETSGDLENWTTLQTLSAPDGVLDLSDPDGLSPAHRFYRTVLLPR